MAGVEGVALSGSDKIAFLGVLVLAFAALTLITIWAGSRRTRQPRIRQHVQYDIARKLGGLEADRD